MGDLFLEEDFRDAGRRRTVSHPSTNLAQRCLTSVIGYEVERSAKIGENRLRCRKGETDLLASSTQGRRSCGVMAKAPTPQVRQRRFKAH